MRSYHSRTVATKDAILLAENIVNTVREPLLVLNSGLKVITASRSFYQFFQVTAEETMGCPVYELGEKQFNIPALRELLKAVLSDNQNFDNYQIDHDFPHIGHRKILLNARRMIGHIGEPQLILLAMENMAEKP